MRLTKTKSLILAVIAIVTALLACREKKPEPVVLPEVNDENCKPENIAKMDKSAQEGFSSQCLRDGSFKPSEPKNW